jgi:Family of unknown function (DUF6459)
MKAGTTSQQRASRIRVRPIPDSSPPVIDSRTALLRDMTPFIQGTLAIGFANDYAKTAGPRKPHAFQEAGAPHGTGAHGDPATHQNPKDPGYFERQHSFSRDLPEPQAWVRHMTQALIEVMSGTRPATQVIRWTTPDVYSMVARRHAASSRRATVARRAIVRHVRICEPADGVVEACAVVVDNGRVRALAMRLIGVDRRWVISELQVG